MCVAEVDSGFTFFLMGICTLYTSLKTLQLVTTYMAFIKEKKR